jgi:hypothetical protein
MEPNAALYVVNLERRPERRARMQALCAPLEAQGLSMEVGEGFLVTSSAGGAAERRHPTGRERKGLSTLQTLQDPILLLLGSAFQVAFKPLPGADGIVCACAVSRCDGRLGAGRGGALSLRRTPVPPLAVSRVADFPPSSVRLELTPRCTLVVKTCSGSPQATP